MIFPVSVNVAKNHIRPRFSAGTDGQRQPNDKPSMPLSRSELSTFDLLVEGLDTSGSPKSIAFPDVKALEDKYAGQREDFVDELIARLGHPDIITQRDLFEHGLWVRSQIRVNGKGKDSLRGYKLYISPFITDEIRERVSYLKPNFYMQEALSPNTAEAPVDIEEDPEQWFRLEMRFIDYFI